MWRIGVDVGGTKIEALALDPNGAETGRRRIPAPRGDYDASIIAIRDLVRSLIAEFAISDLAGVGVGIPGSLSPATGLVRNANSVWLNGRPFRDDLTAALGHPVLVENDANCFALSEAVDGAARDARSVFGVILGTGVGGGLVIDQRVHLGRNGVAGEWGHNPLPWPRADEHPGPACWCGKRGCLETYLSGPALEAEYAQATGERFSVPAIAQRAAEGDAIALAALSRYADRLARAVAAVVNVFDPDVIVFGGGLSNLDKVIAEAQRHLPRWVFSDVCETRLSRNRWGDSSGVRGAAWLPAGRKQ